MQQLDEKDGGDGIFKNGKAGCSGQNRERERRCGSESLRNPSSSPGHSSSMTHSAEGNPLLSGLDWPEIAAAKLAITQAVKLTPEPICEPGLMGLTVFGYNAAVWNVAVLAGSGPAALPFMLLLTGWGWEWWWADAQRTCADPWSWR